MTSIATASPVKTPARILIDVLDPAASPTPTDADAEKAMTQFLDHLRTLDHKFNRKPPSPANLDEQVFGRARHFKNDRERIPFSRYHLRVAYEQLAMLVDEMRARNGGRLTRSELTKWRETLTDYVFDLIDIIPFLQRNVPGYSYFPGGKNAGMHSWEVYGLANRLAYHSAHWSVAPLDHKAAQIASIGVLRQALELRFDRLVSVYPFDKKGKSPRLRHGFHQEFIIANPKFFRQRGCDIAGLRHVYDWCSEIIHQAYQPYAWQISRALERAGELLRSQAAPPGMAWSVDNAVEIVNVEAMQAAFEEHFLANYDHGAWKMARRRPEALVPGWNSSMEITSPDFRPVHNPPGLLRRMRNWVVSYKRGRR